MSHTPTQTAAMSRADKIRDRFKTLVTFLLCAGFVTYAFMVMFSMPAGAW